MSVVGRLVEIDRGSVVMRSLILSSSDELHERTKKEWIGEVVAAVLD